MRLPLPSGPASGDGTLKGGETMLFCGIDWSDQTLEYHLRHAERGELVKGTVAASVAGLADLYATLELHTRPEEIGVAIETCHGVWIQALLDRGYKIYPVSPKAADNFRKALNDSGVKTDAIDSKTLALFLVTFHHDRTPLRPDDPEIVKIRILCQDRLRLSEERVAKVNELTAAIKGYYPAFLGVFGCLDSDIALDFLIQYPTQRQFRKLSAHRFVAWLGRRHYTCRRRIDEMVEKLHAPAFEVAEHLQDSKKHLISYLGRSLKLLNAEIDERDEEINDLLKSLPESDWILSLPGAGGVLGPSLLACIGRDPERFASTGEARAFMGTAPVTKASGKARSVHFRWGCWKFARRTLQLFADQSRHRCAWAAVFYQKQRDSGHGHHAALRALAHRWVKILLAMQRTGSRYDEAIYMRAQRRHLLKCPSVKAAH
jgi:transposase